MLVPVRNVLTVSDDFKPLAMRVVNDGDAERGADDDTADDSAGEADESGMLRDVADALP